MKTVYTIILEKIIQEMEKGVIPWQKPWISLDKSNLSNIIVNKENEIVEIKNSYRGINRLLLGDDYEDFYLTFNEVKKRRGLIKQGSKSRIIVFYKPVIKSEKIEKGDEVIEYKRKSFILRYFRVFQLKDIEGIKRPVLKLKDNKVKPDVEDFISKLGIKIKFGGNYACYTPSNDEITMPDIGRFKDTDNYYSSLFHEILHWSGSENRCKRDLSTVSFTDKYSKEELTAEIGSSFLCNYFGIKKDIENTASYIHSWLKTLRNDKRMIFQSASLSEYALNWLFEKVNLRNYILAGGGDNDENIL